MLVLGPRLQAGQGGQRPERECRTLAEILDALIRGDMLGAAMLAMGRLKAIEASLDAGRGGWNTARHFELAPTPDSGLVNPRDRERAARDQRDHLRTLGPGSGGAAPPRRDKGAGKTGGKRDRQS